MPRHISIQKKRRRILFGDARIRACRTLGFVAVTLFHRKSHVPVMIVRVKFPSATETSPSLYCRIRAALTLPNRVDGRSQRAPATTKPIQPIAHIAGIQLGVRKAWAAPRQLFNQIPVQLMPITIEQDRPTKMNIR